MSRDDYGIVGTGAGWWVLVGVLLGAGIGAGIAGPVSMRGGMFDGVIAVPFGLVAGGLLGLAGAGYLWNRRGRKLGKQLTEELERDRERCDGASGR